MIFIRYLIIKLSWFFEHTLQSLTEDIISRSSVEIIKQVTQSALDIQVSGHRNEGKKILTMLDEEAARHRSEVRKETKLQRPTRSTQLERIP